MTESTPMFLQLNKGQNLIEDSVIKNNGNHRIKEQTTENVSNQSQKQV